MTHLPANKVLVRGALVQHTKTGQVYEVRTNYQDGRVNCEMMFRPDKSNSQKLQTIKKKFLTKFFEIEESAN